MHDLGLISGEEKGESGAPESPPWKFGGG